MLLSVAAEVIGVCLFTLVIATRECNASRVMIYMNGIYFFPAGWQVCKLVCRICCGKKDNNANTSCSLRQAFSCFIPPASLVCACLGIVLDLYFHYKKVIF